MIQRQVKNISEYINALREDEDGSATWFRGHGRAEWELLPGLLRIKGKLSEDSLISRFKQSAAMLAERLPSTSFDWTFLMQHYGVPTRLLDWSESPLVALYFAVSEYKVHPNVDAAIWCLKPTKLNLNANIIDPSEPSFIPSFDADLLQPYSAESMRSGSRVELLPVATIATRNNARIQAQLGTFTIHHKLKIPIEAVGGASHVRKYLVPDGFRKAMYDELRLLGLNQFSLFPELTSVGTILREMMR